MWAVLVDIILLLIKNQLTVQTEKKDQSMRHLLIGLVCLLMWFSTNVSANELAVIAKSGRYLVVDLTTFNVTDVNDEIFIGTWHHRIVNLSGEKQIEKLDGIAGDNHDFHLTDITDRCHVLMSSKPVSDDAQTMFRRVIDIEKNKAMEMFESHRSANFALYNNGKQLLEQKLKSTVVGAGPGVRTTATGVFRVFDSQTGNVIKQFKISELSSSIIKVVETNSQYLAVLAGEYELQILNLQSHKIIKTIKIPFKKFLVI